MNGNGFNNNGQNGNNYYEEDYAFTMVTNNGKPKTLGWSVASMTFGILSVITCCFGYSALVLGVISVILAVVSRKNLGYFNGMSVAGLVLGIIGFVFGAAMIITIIFADESLFEQYREYFDMYYGSGSEGSPSDF